MIQSGGSAASADGRRLDRWLWFARVVKSRTMAAELIENGRVRINRQKTTKPSQIVKPGDVLTIMVAERIRILEVRAVGERRGPAVEAQDLFADLTPPPPPREPAGAAPGSGERDAGSGRPTKRERRATERLKGET